jgi:hypothetical protein
MATTSNYGWTTPDDTSLVKDGASAIRTLGSAIDTSLNTALGTKKSGLVLLNTTTFSAQSSQAVNSVFSATYRNYRITFDITGNTADATIYLKFRSGTTDNSTSYYYQLGQFTESSTLTYAVAANQTTGFSICEVDGANSVHYQALSIDIFRPFEAVYTAGHLQASSQSTGGALLGRQGALQHLQAVSYDGINIIASAGNITGAIQVYGYNQ